MKNVYLVFILAVFQLNAMGAAVRADSLWSNDPLSDFNYENIRLLPLSVFLEAAKSYADVRFYDAKVREQELMLKISRKEWLKYFRLQGNYQYGTNNSYFLQSGEVYPQEPMVSSIKTQSWYNVGVMVSVPLDDVFARKNKNDAARSRLAQAGFELQKTLENRQIVILESYNEVVKNLALLKVKAEAMALYDAQMQVSERDFVNGHIDIISLSLERARRTEAMIKYQEGRAELHNAVMVLEMLTGIRISDLQPERPIEEPVEESTDQLNRSKNRSVNRTID